MSNEEWAFFAPFMIEAGPRRGRQPRDHCLVLYGVFAALTTDRGQSIPNDRQHHRPRSPAGGDRKRGTKDQPLGRSRGGLTTKIHILADPIGRPLRLIVTVGQVGDITQVPVLLDGQAGDAVLADKTLDSNALRALIADMQAEAVITSNRSRKVLIPHDTAAYKHRNRIERCFNRLKHFRRFATRYDQRTIHFNWFVHVAAAMIWLH
jgi:transposase